MTDAGDARLPQLLMRLASLDDLPEPRVTEGAVLREASADDEPALAALLSQSFESSWTPEAVAASLTRAEDVDRVYVLSVRGELKATGSARVDQRNTPGAGYVHWVATTPSARRCGYGKAVCLAVLRRFAALGLREAVLETDDHRLSAIRLYLALGFKPEPRHRADKERWDRILAALAGSSKEI